MMDHKSDADIDDDNGDDADLFVFTSSDFNRDNKWDKTEWANAGCKVSNFASADLNKDGYLTEAELSKAADRINRPKR